MRTENNRSETNRLLAEFLNAKYSKEEDLYYFPSIFCKSGRNYFYSFDLLFHSDWNWLMQVVEKIEDLGYSLEINKQEENDYQCNIVKSNNIIHSHYNISKIEAVYNACIEFVKWYNENSVSS